MKSYSLRHAVIKAGMMILTAVLTPEGSARAGVKDGLLDIYWVDVEGGGATLIVTPAGESVLIDTGSAFERDAGRIFKVATEVAGLARIDHLETALVCPVNRVGEVDVYQVNHHGLDVSNNPVFVHALAPRISVMNNGARKGTAASTLAALRTSPGLAAMYQLHKNVRDDVENNTTDELIANLAEKCAGNFIKLAVAPDGRSYTVTIPASGHAKTYRTRKIP